MPSYVLPSIWTSAPQEFWSSSGADVIVLGSGDGELVCDLARNLRQLRRRWTILTLSLAGSTSRRLEAACNPYIDGNIEIGLDCLHPRV